MKGQTKDPRKKKAKGKEEEECTRVPNCSYPPTPTPDDVFEGAPTFSSLLPPLAFIISLSPRGTMGGRVGR